MALVLTLHPKLTRKQKEILRTPKKGLVLDGPAGTSKTYIALAKALRLLEKGEVDKIMILRSAVEIRKLGFLPGDADDKLEPYTDPYVGLIAELSPKKNYRSFVAAKEIEFHSTSFLRGVTFRNAYVIVDEFQNMNEHELDTIATRLSDDTHIAFCGDTSGQSDLTGSESREHRNVIDIFKAMDDDFDTFVFGIEDIVRSGIVKRYYEAKLGRPVRSLPMLQPLSNDPVRPSEDRPMQQDHGLYAPRIHYNTTDQESHTSPN